MNKTRRKTAALCHRGNAILFLLREFTPPSSQAQSGPAPESFTQTGGHSETKEPSGFAVRGPRRPIH